ncbi:hypothetical protein [Ectobacillus funiculus]|uniref:Restriction endonuclease n=1 Tax=Ectobacillus funiculus TaxID=137993 RepID=A0ABV5WLZ2_9BACI
MELRDQLKAYCDALVKGMEAENWYLSLIAAFALPDICNSLEDKHGGDNYAEWFDKYVTQYRATIYRGEDDQVITRPDGGTITTRKKSSPLIEVERHEVLTGVIAYALRSAFLHNGGGEVAEERITKKPKHQDSLLGIEKVKFLASPTNLSTYQKDNTIYLNPKVYCYAILQGIDKWILDKVNDEVVLNNTEKLIIFEDC